MRCPRSSLAVEVAIIELVAMLKAPLTEAELTAMIPKENPNNEPDAYTFVLNCFTQKNTESLVKCTYVCRSYPSLRLIVMISLLQASLCELLIYLVFHQITSHSAHPSQST